MDAVQQQPRMTPAARRILEAAAELFVAHGIHAVGVDRIAAESGVTKRTLYDRFGSKDALVAAYLQARHDAWWERWEARTRDEPSPRALAVFDAYAEAPGVARGCAFLNAAGELPEEHPGFAVIREHKRLVRERLEALIAQDGVDDAAALAEHVFLLVEGAVAHRGIDGDAARLARARAIAGALLAPASSA